jgi:citrate synthase
MTVNTIAKGLAGIEVDTTAICLVDGDAGRLYYRDLAIDDLVDWPFADVVHLVLTGTRPTDQRFAAALAEGQALSDAETMLVDAAVGSGTHPMQVLQAITPLLDRTRAFAEFGEAAQGLVIAAKLPAVLGRIMNSRGGAGNNLFAVGDRSNEDRSLEITQILQIEHGFNASTFTARVVASTLAPIENCLSAALGALHGPLHGGADQAALEMAERVGDPGKANDFVDRCLANGTKIMGMGHREYRLLDPRARFVKEFAREIAMDGPLESLFLTLEAIEDHFRARMLERDKSLHANLEFYKGIVYRAAGLPNDCFTAAFALARVYGYVAHFIESRADNKLIRPAARYVGRVRPIANAG